VPGNQHSYSDSLFGHVFEYGEAVFNGRLGLVARFKVITYGMIRGFVYYKSL
jgi:hypothetical protein